MPASGLVQHPVILYMKRKETVGRRKCSCYLIWSIMVLLPLLSFLLLLLLLVISGWLFCIEFPEHFFLYAAAQQLRIKVIL